MPDTLRDALNVRVQTLSDEAQQVVELAAVAGNRVDHELLAAAVGERTGSTSTAACGRRSTPRCSPRTRPGTASATHCCARWCTTTCCLASTPGCTLASPPCSRLTPSWSVRAPHRWRSPHHWSAAHEVNKAFRWSITAARSGAAAYHETLKMYERALELWDQVDDPESVAGPRAGVLKQAANAASDAGEDERALALVTAALAEFGPASDAEERITALMLKASLLGGLLRPGHRGAAAGGDDPAARRRRPGAAGPGDGGVRATV